MKLTTLLVATVLFIACNNAQTTETKKQNIETGVLTDDLDYTCKEIGWKTKIPQNWGVMDMAAVNKMTADGLAKIKENSNVELNTEGLTQLVNLKKDRFNYFLSSIEPYDATAFASYDEHVDELAGVITDAYKAKNIQYEYAKSATTIDGLEFKVLEIKIFTPDKKEVLMTQRLLLKAIDKYDFGITLMYNSEKDMETLQAIIDKSKFSIRN
jgi:hypothetical protein